MTDHPLAFLTRPSAQGTDDGAVSGQSISRSGPFRRYVIADGQRTVPGAPPKDEAETWAKWIEQVTPIGRRTGHTVCRCPSCDECVLASILNASGTSRWLKSGGGWPRCKVCPGEEKDRPRTAPIDDVTLVRRLRPGHPRTKRQLQEDGLAITPGEPSA